jgi:hypothetical protein
MIKPGTASSSSATNNQDGTNHLTLFDTNDAFISPLMNFLKTPDLSEIQPTQTEKLLGYAGWSPISYSTHLLIFVAEQGGERSLEVGHISPKLGDFISGNFGADDAQGEEGSNSQANEENGRKKWQDFKDLVTIEVAKEGDANGKSGGKSNESSGGGSSGGESSSSSDGKNPKRVAALPKVDKIVEVLRIRLEKLVKYAIKDLEREDKRRSEGKEALAHDRVSINKEERKEFREELELIKGLVAVT